TINGVDAGLTNSAQGHGGGPSEVNSHQVRTGNRPKTTKALGGIGVARCVEAGTREGRQFPGKYSTWTRFEGHQRVCRSGDSRPAHSNVSANCCSLRAAARSR